MSALFLKHFPALVRKGHIFVAMPPLFRVDVGKQVFYALDEEEKRILLERIEKEKIRGQVSVTRFKGLGEMNPVQLRESTIHPDTRRLVQLTIDDPGETRSLMTCCSARSAPATASPGSKPRATWPRWRCDHESRPPQTNDRLSHANSEIERLLRHALLCGNAFAQSATIPLEISAKRPEYRGAEISPSGKYVSVIAPFENHDAVHIINLEKDFERTVVKFDPKQEESISDTSWSDDDRLVASKAKHFGMLKQPMLTGAVYATDADGKAQKQLFGYVPDASNIRSPLKDRATAYLMDILPNSNGQALFTYLPWDQSRSEDKSAVFRVDTHTGKRTQIESFDGGYVVADESGALRFKIDSTDQDEPINWYRPNGGSGDWVRLPASLAGRTVQPMAFEPDNNHVFALVSDAGEPSALYRLNLSAGTRERLAGNPLLSVSNVLWGGYEDKPFAVAYNAGRPKIDYVDPKSEWAQLHAGLMKLFAGQMVTFINFSKDNKKLLFYVHSDRHPGSYLPFRPRDQQAGTFVRNHGLINPMQWPPPFPSSSRIGTARPCSDS